MLKKTLKQLADAENEVHDASDFADESYCTITPILQLERSVALAISEALAGVVSAGHNRSECQVPDEEGVLRAQLFEEGAVFMLQPPYQGFSADRYVMDFYDISERGICSRMHFHTGMRYVRIMTGPDTVVQISTLTEPVISEAVAPDVKLMAKEGFALVNDGTELVACFETLVPENSWVDMQIPKATSHQFNATGVNAVLDTVHPEESIEVFRENMSGIGMMKQTIFLSEVHPHADSCISKIETNYERGINLT